VVAIRQRDVGAVAVTDQVRPADLKLFEEYHRVRGHERIADRSGDVGCVSVAPPLGGEHVEALREGRNCSSEFRGVAEAAVQQHERVTAAMFGVPGLHATGVYVTHGESLNRRVRVIRWPAVRLPCVSVADTASGDAAQVLVAVERLLSPFPGE
jgi:hypothetical protein